MAGPRRSVSSLSAAERWDGMAARLDRSRSGVAVCGDEPAGFRGLKYSRIVW